MTSEYTKTEVAKIIDQKDNDFSLNWALASAWMMGNLKGENLKIFDVRGQSSLSDYYIVASATNAVQANAMADDIQSQLKEHGAKTISVEGINDGEWILIDMGDIMVHIFTDVTRDIYDLDGVWKDAAQIDIPNEYYFSGPDSETQEKPSKDDQGYF